MADDSNNVDPPELCVHFERQGKEGGEAFGVCKLATHLKGGREVQVWSDICKKCQREWKYLLPPTKEYPTYTVLELVRDEPTLVKKVWNYAKAGVKHIADGLKDAPTDVQQTRLLICADCPINVNGVCTHPDCGCPLEEKTRWASEECPVGLWPAHSESKDSGCGCRH